ncbi:PREDICTED: MATH domain and coiled-coil domain-containing protein At2g42470-like [Camelina sativa]|uniref:MATH domain and coiled-coil domain-containing protein At2g42470-like n=1 Tax=Camelina sativa TaxID=90675 RepID=A0ABM0Z054_CAMSA|nr:PREDICTED: MATH domain and coiled-coil domain-containing protein At2g42470-like [Camelina sativa]
MGNRMQKISDARNQKQTSFTFEIDNFSEKKAEISSPLFGCGGCEWYVTVHPMGDHCCDHLAVYMNVARTKSFRTGWKKRVSYRFVLLNQSGKELQTFGTPKEGSLFCDEARGWGYPKVLPLSKLKEEDFLENDKLIIQVELQVVEDVHVEEVTRKGMLDLNGFEVHYTKGVLVSKIFAKHPDIAVDVKPTNQVVKTAYMDVLLSLIETLRKPPQSFSNADVGKALRNLKELTEAGFRLDWLKEKLDEVVSKRKNATDDGSQVKEMEEHIKSLELVLLNLKVELNKEKAKAAASVKLLPLDDIV